MLVQSCAHVALPLPHSSTSVERENGGGGGGETEGRVLHGMDYRDLIGQSTVFLPIYTMCVNVCVCVCTCTVV